MPIRAITFDWGDTLAANHGMPYVATQRRAFAELAHELREMGFHADQRWIDTAIAEIEAAWRSTISFQENPDHREIDMTAMFNTWIARVVGFDADVSRLQLALEKCKATLTDTVIPYAEAAPALSLLKARGYRLGVLSHVPWPGDACRDWFKRHGLAAYLDFYSLSCEVGWIKPNPRHYQHALDQAGCRADEVLHVGDHPERDIVGARKFGFKTCLRHTENIYPHDALHACKPDAEILHLTELVDIAKRLS